MRDIELRSGSSAVGLTVKEWLQRGGGAQILAVKKKNGTLTANPPEDMKLELGDEIVVVGTRDQLKVIDPML
ncbi:MAG: TrkA C-terminal domain-containing protein [Dehalococcoidia bacterium]|nr:TrkA C-terminal domain-containing protein [Dehalococcoidia bacterium]